MDTLNDIYRRRWLKARQAFEAQGNRAFPLHQDATISIKDPLAWAFRILRFFLKITGLLALGRKQAQKIKLTHNRIQSAKIGTRPLKVLHLSDLHLDECVVDLELIKWKIKEAGAFHYAVITGDLLSNWSHSQEDNNLEKVKAIVDYLTSAQKTYFVLGNHDSYQCVELLETLGVTVLTNQVDEHPPLDFNHGIEFIGTDDPHYFYTDDALKIMQEGNPYNYRIALVHTPELYKNASENNIDLYLCGHTHAGQFAFPGGHAPMKRVYRGRRFYKKAWSFRGMSGYTSSGVGTSTIEARFFTTAEITLHEITSKNPPL